MKKSLGLTRKRSIFFHSLQQACAFICVVCFIMLYVYSFASIKVTNAELGSQQIVYDLDLFAEEERFEETATFDNMLMQALKEIIRYNVAKSQLEVDGRFDGTKVIDIEAFANRKNDLAIGRDTLFDYEQEAIKDGSVGLVDINYGNYYSPSYYLEDLLKWEKYGIYYETVEMSGPDFLNYFPEDWYYRYDGMLTPEQQSILNAWMTNGMISNASSDYDSVKIEGVQEENVIATDENGMTFANEKEYEAYYAKEFQVRMYQALADILAKQNNIISSLYYDSETDMLMVRVQLLQERYQTVDGNRLEDYARSWEEYRTLVSYVEQAVNDLSYNYKEYLGFKERYGEGMTNIVYTFKMTMMGEAVEVSNLPKQVSDDELDYHYKSAYGKYMIYRPQSMYFVSNTGIIQESNLFEAFSNYEYAYPETAQIWIAVNTDYPVDDPFAQANAAYSFLNPYAQAVLGIGIAAAVMWLLLFLFLSVMTGYRKQKGEKEGELALSWFDSIPTEIALLLGAGAAFFLVNGGLIAIYNFSSEWLDYVAANRLKISFISGLSGLLASMLACLFWYSLLRRLKARTLWKDSLMRWIWNVFFRRIFAVVKKPLLTIYDNSSIWLRGILLLGSIMFVNFFMGVAAYYYWNRGRGGLKELTLLVLVGVVLFDGAIVYLWFLNQLKRKKIVDGIARIKEGELHYQVKTDTLHGDNLQLAEAVNSIGEGIKTAVETSMKDERLKADLITNVSHDIKTPLTSIINYVDLLKRENIETEPVKGYIEILDAKSQRLKQLTDDLVEASKISSGNITLIMEKINLTELLNQSLGEFSAKFEEKNLRVMDGFSGEAVYVEADSRRIWRVVENLFGNICKYALDGTRVYLDMEVTCEGKKVCLSVKNISAQPLNIQAEELTERFIRGDVSRSTEGSGLGLSIAKNLTELQNGSFAIYLDGDLFKVTLTFPVYEEKTEEI